MTKPVAEVLVHAEKLCQEKGVRLTAKRKNVLSGLLVSNKALSAYELVEVCKTEFQQTIPVMSVYRILEFLEHEQLVHKLNLANKYIACAHITCDHSHAVPQFLICRECNKVKEISVDKTTINELKNNVETAGFYLVSPQLEMNCLCAECMKNTH